MENQKWTREEAEENKNKLLEELKTDYNISNKNLNYVTEEINKLINEEEERQKQQL